MRLEALSDCGQTLRCRPRPTITHAASLLGKRMQGCYFSQGTHHKVALLFALHLPECDAYVVCVHRPVDVVKVGDGLLPVARFLGLPVQITALLELAVALLAESPDTATEKR